MSRALARKSFVSAESACGFVTLLCFNVHEAEDLARYREATTRCAWKNAYEP